mmetsp:Transcript_19309/g.44916  ORF Transcript_19309/g.44916 Transcript_19309/m.44916 type:complete len:236 (+) Transcript_19309:841-1548(+)
MVAVLRVQAEVLHLLLRFFGAVAVDKNRLHFRHVDSFACLACLGLEKLLRCKLDPFSFLLASYSSLGMRHLLWLALRRFSRNWVVSHGRSSAGHFSVWHHGSVCASLNHLVGQWRFFWLRGARCDTWSRCGRFPVLHAPPEPGAAAQHCLAGAACGSDAQTPCDDQDLHAVPRAGLRANCSRTHVQDSKDEHWQRQEPKTPSEKVGPIEDIADLTSIVLHDAPLHHASRRRSNQS